MHTYSRSAQDSQINSEKHLEAEKIDVRINPKSENRKQKRFSGVGLSESIGSDKHSKEAGLSDPIEFTSDFESEYSTESMLWGAEKCKWVWIIRPGQKSTSDEWSDSVLKSMFSAGFFLSVGPDDPTGLCQSVRLMLRVIDQ